jgi:hypothetical protein
MNRQRYGTEELFAELFGQPIDQIEYPYHPSEKTLQLFLANRLRTRPAFSEERRRQLQRGQVADWSRTEVSAHLLTCIRCAERIEQLHQPAPTTVGGWARAKQLLTLGPLRPSAGPLPGLARVIMAAQFIVILSLTGLIYFKPAPLSSSARFAAPAAKTLHSPPSPTAPRSSESPTAGPLLGEAQLIPVLSKQLESSDPKTQIQAAERLAELGDPRGIEPLLQAYSSSRDLRVREITKRALGEIYEKAENDYYQIVQSFSKLKDDIAQQSGQNPGLLSDLSDLVSRLKIDVNMAAGETIELDYPHAIKIVFHQDVTLREVTSLARSVGGVFTMPDSSVDEIVLKLPPQPDEALKALIFQVERSPRVRTVQRLK